MQLKPILPGIQTFTASPTYNHHVPAMANDFTFAKRPLGKSPLKRLKNALKNSGLKGS